LCYLLREKEEDGEKKGEKKGEERAKAGHCVFYTTVLAIVRTNSQQSRNVYTDKESDLRMNRENSQQSWEGRTITTTMLTLTGRNG
jgi:hypothetical protein